jgi:hypothetical protein
MSPIFRVEEYMEQENRVKSSDKRNSGFFLDLFSCFEDGGNMFLRNVGRLSLDYMASCSRRQLLATNKCSALSVGRLEKFPGIAPRCGSLYRNTYCSRTRVQDPYTFVALRPISFSSVASSQRHRTFPVVPWR